MNTRGFTLLELMVTIAILGVLLVVAVPSFSDLIERRRIIGVAEEVFGQLAFARMEAVKRSRPITVSFDADGTTTWTIGITDHNVAGGACDTDQTAATPENSTDGVDDNNACVIDIDGNSALDADGDGYMSDFLLYRTANADPVRMNAPTFTGTPGACLADRTYETCFDPIRGTSRNGTVVLQTDKYELRIILNTLGRPRICTPDTAKLPTYPDCT